MVRTRIIPLLLLKNQGLVKTVKFKNPTYIGDPINAVRIFNDKEVDELVFLDITATVTNGKVTVVGSVKSEQMKSKIEKLVRAIKGVKSVDNQIVVVTG